MGVAGSEPAHHPRLQDRGRGLTRDASRLPGAARAARLHQRGGRGRAERGARVHAARGAVGVRGAVRRPSAGQENAVLAVGAAAADARAAGVRRHGRLRHKDGAAGDVQDAEGWKVGIEGKTELGVGGEKDGQSGHENPDEHRHRHYHQSADQADSGLVRFRFR